MAQHRGKRPSVAGTSRQGEQTSAAGAEPALRKAAARKPRTASVETIEARLDRKAAIADGKMFAAESLGQLSREQRHKLLYGD
jgi:hypothetical protein